MLVTPVTVSYTHAARIRPTVAAPESDHQLMFLQSIHGLISERQSILYNMAFTIFGIGLTTVSIPPRCPAPGVRDEDQQLIHTYAPERQADKTVV